jgi:hypothetical protein
MIRTARGQSEHGGKPAFGFDRSQKTPSNQLIQPGPMKYLSSSARFSEVRRFWLRSHA